MIGDKHEFEWIVAEVLRRLKQRADAPAAAETPAAPRTNNVVASGDLVIDDHVVSLETVADRLRGKQRMLVGSRAVVTPAVRDELRKRGVRLERSEEAASPARRSAKVTVMVGTSGAAARELASAAAELGCHRLTSQDPRTAVGQLITQLSHPEASAIWLSDQPLLAACLANRAPQIRAAVAGDVSQVQQARVSIGANLLIVDPQQVTVFQWKQIVAEFGRAVSRNCPQPLTPNVT